MMMHSTLRELKEAINKDLLENPQLYNKIYKNEKWINNIMKTSSSYDNRHVLTEWQPIGISNEGKVWYALVDFVFINY